jgi:RNA polymerase sigma-70 factor, ECF subfamily
MMRAILSGITQTPALVLASATLSADIRANWRYDHSIVINGQDESPISEINDCVLMKRIAARDDEALRVLYERYAPTLLAMCLRIVSDRFEAEQILLDVFWETWDRAHRYDSERSAPLTYLTLMTRSRALDARRRRKPPTATGFDYEYQSSDGLDSTPTESAKSAPLNHLLAGEEAQSLRDALMSLDDDERSLIEACFYDGYTHVELAAKLQQPLGTVKTRIRRGLARLRTRLRKVFDEPYSISDPMVADESADESKVR